MGIELKALLKLAKTNTTKGFSPKKGISQPQNQVKILCKYSKFTIYFAGTLLS